MVRNEKTQRARLGRFVLSGFSSRETSVHLSGLDVAHVPLGRSILALTPRSGLLHAVLVKLEEKATYKKANNECAETSIDAVQ